MNQTNQRWKMQEEVPLLAAIGMLRVLYVIYLLQQENVIMVT